MFIDSLNYTKKGTTIITTTNQLENQDQSTTSDSVESSYTIFTLAVGKGTILLILLEICEWG